MIHTTETTIKLALIVNCSWETEDWMGHEDCAPRSPQGSQISTKITYIKKRITVLSKFLHILESVSQSHHTPMQGTVFHQYYAFAVWWKAPVWRLTEVDAVQSHDFFQNKLTTHTYNQLYHTSAMFLPFSFFFPPHGFHQIWFKAKCPQRARLQRVPQLPVDLTSSS